MRYRNWEKQVIRKGTVWDWRRILRKRCKNWTTYYKIVERKKINWRWSRTEEEFEEKGRKREIRDLDEPRNTYEHSMALFGYHFQFSPPVTLYFLISFSLFYFYCFLLFQRFCVSLTSLWSLFLLIAYLFLFLFLVLSFTSLFSISSSCIRRLPTLIYLLHHRLETVSPPHLCSSRSPLVPFVSSSCSLSLFLFLIHHPFIPFHFCLFYFRGYHSSSSPPSHSHKKSGKNLKCYKEKE